MTMVMRWKESVEHAMASRADILSMFGYKIHIIISHTTIWAKCGLLSWQLHECKRVLLYQLETG